MDKRADFLNSIYPGLASWGYSEHTIAYYFQPDIKRLDIHVFAIEIYSFLDFFFFFN